MVCSDEVENVQTMTPAQALQYIQEEKCASFILQSQPGEFYIVNVINFLVSIILHNKKPSQVRRRGFD